LQSELYIAVIVIMSFFFMVIIVTIITLFPKKKMPISTTLGSLRQQFESIHQKMLDLQGQIWSYGSSEEEKSKYWRIACLGVAEKAVIVLQSCYLEREQSEAARAVYDELLMSLMSIGIGEISPSLGEEIDENDQRYRINKREGKPPFGVSKILYPGYYFKPRLNKASEGSDEFIIAPALIEVVGKKPDIVK
jgi:hypothetical protein